MSWQARMGTAINGFPVMLQTQVLDYRVVLVDRRAEYPDDPWVTAEQHVGLLRGWVMGHYFVDRNEAMADYKERALRLLGELG